MNNECDLAWFMDQLDFLLTHFTEATKSLVGAGPKSLLAALVHNVHLWAHV